LESKGIGEGEKVQNRFNISRALLTAEDLFQPGGLSCQGCGAALSMKLALKALGKRTIVVIPACCWTIIVGSYPYTTLKVPIIHVPFETAAVVASGIRAALDIRGEQDIVVMAWAGDGGTFDIGLQALSGAAERNDDILYVCYDNEAYMNTGIQRSSATPMGAWTTTTPEGALKEEPKKDMEGIMLAHGIPYVATASVAFPDDLINKFQKARYIKGTKFIHLLSPCPPGWRIEPSKSIQIARMATQCHLFPIYEVENGRYRITVRPDTTISVEKYIKAQGRFSRIDKDTIKKIQEHTELRWQRLLDLTRS